MNFVSPQEPNLAREEWQRRLRDKLRERGVPEAEWPRYFEGMYKFTIPNFDWDQEPPPRTPAPR
jgi:hypothetical protein